LNEFCWKTDREKWKVEEGDNGIEIQKNKIIPFFRKYKGNSK